jgi:lambda repressor-like predicted transcriptional regulator
LRAQKRLTLRWEHLSDDELLSRLKSLFAKEGRLSEKIINATLGVPSIDVYEERFGSLRNAYQRIGYKLKWDFDWVDRRDEFNELIRGTAADLIARLQKEGWSARFEPGFDVLTVDDRVAISLRLARSWRCPGRKLIWTINRRISMPEGYIIAIRLGEANKSVLDYLLLPTSAMIGGKIRFEKSFEAIRQAKLSPIQDVLLEPSQAGRSQSDPNPAPEKRSAARGANRAQKEISADQPAIVSFEFAVEFGYFDEFGNWFRHERAPDIARHLIIADLPDGSRSSSDYRN